MLEAFGPMMVDSVSRYELSDLKKLAEVGVYSLCLRMVVSPNTISVTLDVAQTHRSGMHVCPAIAGLIAELTPCRRTCQCCVDS